MAANIGIEILKAVGPSVLGAILGSGDSKAGQQAIQQQLALAQALVKMQQQQFGVDLPFRKNLFAGLNQRQQQRFPSIRPRSLAQNNPLANVRRFGSGRATPGDNTSRRVPVQLPHESAPQAQRISLPQGLGAGVGPRITDPGGHLAGGVAAGGGGTGGGGGSVTGINSAHMKALMLAMRQTLARSLARR